MLKFRAERLQAFVSVAREGGFTAAARHLHRSQSSISQAVALLEAELDEPLLVRDGRSVHLTAAGQLLLEGAERAFAELDAAHAQMAALRQLTTGSLRVGSSDTLATYLLPAVFAAYRARYPGIEVRLVNRPSPVLAVQVAQRELDVAIVSLPLPSSSSGSSRSAHQSRELHIESLRAQRDKLICPPGHTLAQRKTISLAALAPYALLLLDRSTATRALLDARFAALEIEPRVVMEMSSVEVLKRFVELGFGISIVPAMSAEREVEQGTLASVDLRGLGRDRSVGILTPTSGPLSRAAAAFIDIARAEL